MLFKFHAQLVVEADFEVDSKMYPSLDFGSMTDEEIIAAVHNIESNNLVWDTEAYFEGNKNTESVANITNIEIRK